MLTALRTCRRLWWWNVLFIVSERDEVIGYLTSAISLAIGDSSSLGASPALFCRDHCLNGWWRVACIENPCFRDRQVEPAAPTIVVLISKIYIDSRPLESCQIIPHNGGLRPSERRGCRGLFTALAGTMARTREGSTCPHYNMRFMYHKT